MEFTPGPWEVEGLAIYKLDDNGNHKLSIQIRPDLNAKQSYSELCCNARLIVAAPDMYEVLEKIIDDYDDDMVYHQISLDTITTARAVLKKARGEGE